MSTANRERTDTILDRHFNAIDRGDLDGLMEEYADDALFFTPEGLLQGRSEIRSFVEKLVPDLPSASDVEVLVHNQNDNVIYVVWSGESDTLDIPFATDTFVFRDGQIAVQTFAAQMEAKPST